MRKEESRKREVEIERSVIDREEIKRGVGKLM